MNSNSATLQGGGIYNLNGIIIVDNSGLSENTAPLGGGILNSGTITVSNSTLASNSAVEGGGIWNESTLTISDSTLADNMASNIGGGIFNSSSDSGGTITVSNSTFSSNSAVNAGGGIATYNMLEMGNSTFSGNTANAGGGIFNKVGTSDIESSTLSDNSANSGSGVYNSEGSTTLSNSIIANSMNGSDCFGTIIDAGYNLVEDNSCGFSGGSDPKLGPLADNGGATWTHALLPGSPLSNLIPPGSCMLTADQRGVARPQNTNCDVGAYELWQLNIGVNSPSELTLIWENAAANCVYDVYEETTPYFTPTNATYTGQSSGVVYPQLGDVVTNYFYVVAAMCDGVSPGEGTTAVSNTVGEFDFALVTSN